jgi:hypothetical protein
MSCQYVLLINNHRVRSADCVYCCFKPRQRTVKDTSLAVRNTSVTGIPTAAAEVEQPHLNEGSAV